MSEKGAAYSGRKAVHESVDEFVDRTCAVMSTGPRIVGMEYESRGDTKGGGAWIGGIGGRIFVVPVHRGV